MGGTWTDREILAEIGKRTWYHKIQLRPGIATPGLKILEPLWESTRKSRAHINYTGKRVLDIASFDGMWAFEAEKLGASLVVATDCMQPLYSNFELCKDILGSKVLPLYNISPYNLWEGLKVLLMDDFTVPLPFPQQIRHNLFDIVQHTGLLYHVRDPLWTLSQARSVIKTGGHLLLETACILDDNESKMIYNGPPGNMTESITTSPPTGFLPSGACGKCSPARCLKYCRKASRRSARERKTTIRSAASPWWQERSAGAKPPPIRMRSCCAFTVIRADRKSVV